MEPELNPEQHWLRGQVNSWLSTPKAHPRALHGSLRAIKQHHPPSLRRNPREGAQTGPESRSIKLFHSSWAFGGFCVCFCVAEVLGIALQEQGIVVVGTAPRGCADGPEPG